MRSRIARLGDVVGGALTNLGALALAGQFVIDFAVMELAGGEETAGELFNQLQDSWLLSAVSYTVGPTLLFLGLIVLRAGMTRSSMVWTGRVLIAGSALIGIARIIELRAIEAVALLTIAAALGLLALGPRRQP